ncbi:MAG TPA: hypothetical protein VN669_03555 [Candidatus Acidoferrales bacterium]|jgi:type II secretory pathway pseudopilin PulG|nr:hypothetical protein [Candidatus Acidoferrales bacterium]
MKFLCSKKRNQRGYLLLSVMLLITLMLIMLAAEAPRVAQQIKRAKEEELVHRGKEYAIAIKKYVHKMGNYPTSLEQLEDTNHIRFLRKRYNDPMTGKADWKLIHVGEAEIKIPQNKNPGLEGSGNPGLTGSTPSAGTQPGSTGLSQSSGLSQSPTGVTGLNSGGTQPNQNQIGALTTSNIGTGQPIGGGGIIGVASTSKQTGIKEFNDNSEYDQWLFVYDPKLEQATASSGAAADAGVIVAAPRAGAASNGEGPAPSGSPVPAGNSNPNATPNSNATPNPSPGF